MTSPITVTYSIPAVRTNESAYPYVAVSIKSRISSLSRIKIFPIQYSANGVPGVPAHREDLAHLLARPTPPP